MLLTINTLKYLVIMFGVYSGHRIRFIKSDLMKNYDKLSDAKVYKISFIASVG